MLAGRAHFFGGHKLLFFDVFEQLDVVGAGEGRTTGEHLVQNRAHAPQIGRRGVLLVLQDFGGHIERRATQSGGHAVGPHVPGKPKIRNLQQPLGLVGLFVQEEVLGLEIAMYQIQPAQHAEARGQLPQKSFGFLFRQEFVPLHEIALDVLAHITAIAVLQSEIVVAFSLPIMKQPDNIGMVEFVHDLNLFSQVGFMLAVLLDFVLANALDGKTLSGFGLDAFVHHSKRARADFTADVIATHVPNSTRLGIVRLAGARTLLSRSGHCLVRWQCSIAMRGRRLIGVDWSMGLDVAGSRQIGSEGGIMYRRRARG